MRKRVWRKRALLEFGLLRLYVLRLLVQLGWLRGVALLVLFVTSQVAGEMIAYWAVVALAVVVGLRGADTF
jgi:hypothetical protein